MDYTIIDAHAFLLLRQDTMVDGLPVRTLEQNYSCRSNYQQMLEFIRESGADVVIEAVGSSVTYVMAADEVGFAGRMVCIGYVKSEVTFQTKLFVQKEQDTRGSRNELPADL